MSQYLTPFTVTPSDDYIPVISLPLEVGSRTIKLRVMGQFLNGIQQMLSQLQCKDGLVLESVVASGDIVMTAFNGSLGGTVIEIDVNPAPNNPGDWFIATLNASFTVTTAGALQYGATVGQGDATTVEIQAALFEV